MLSLTDTHRELSLTGDAYDFRAQGKDYISITSFYLLKKGDKFNNRVKYLILALKYHEWKQYGESI